MATTHYILATAGHVDHGKSSLVKAAHAKEVPAEAEVVSTETEVSE
jgi:selenocysteine-specific translation elongation factor